MMITQVMVCCVGILVIRLTVADWQEEIKFESRDSTHSTVSRVIGPQGGDCIYRPYVLAAVVNHNHRVL